MSFLGGVFGGSSQKMCRNCGQKPVFQGHEYCGKTCAEWAKKNPPAPAASNWGPPPQPPGPAPGWGYGNYGGPAPPPPQPQQQRQWPQYNQFQQGPQQAPGGQMCQHCRTKPVYQGHQYCSKTCGSLAKQGGPPPMPAQPQGPPQGYNGYAPQGGPWPPQGPQGPPQAWGPGPQGGGQWPGPPQGGGWQGAPQRGGQAWGPPSQRNWNQGGPQRRPRGGYDDDDGDEWPDDDDEEWEDEPPRPKRTSLAKKGTKMCMNCFQHPSVGKTEFCSKKCKTDAEAKLGGKGSKGGARRSQPSARRRASEWDDD